MSDVSTFYGDQLVRSKRDQWIRDFDNHGRWGEDTMARVSSLAVSEVAERLGVEEKQVLYWLRRYDIPHHRGTLTGVLRVRLIDYPVLVALKDGATINQARDTVADIHKRLEARPGGTA